MTISLRYVLLFSVVLLSVACGEGTPTPASGEEVLERMVDAMAGVESYRFEGSRTHHETQNEYEISEEMSFEGERGPNESYFVSTRAQASYGSGEPTVVETIAADGVVVQRVAEGPQLGDSEPAPWEESLYHPFGKPYEAPPIEMAGQIALTSYTTEVSTGEAKIFSVHGTAGRASTEEGVLPATWDVELVIAADSYRLLKITTRSEQDQSNEQTPISSVTTTEHRLFDFDAPVDIALPSEYIHAAYSGYVFSIEGEVDEERLREGVPNVVHSQGTNSMSIGVEADEVVVRIFGDTLAPGPLEASLEKAFPGVQFTLKGYAPPYDRRGTSTPLAPPTPTR